VRREQQHPLKIRGADVAVGAAGADDARVRLAEDGQLVDVRVVVLADGRIAGRVTAAAGGRGRRRRVVRVVLVGGHGGRHLLLRVLACRLLLGHGAPDAQRVVARQQHRVYEKLFARGTPQLLLHGVGRMSTTRLTARGARARSVRAAPAGWPRRVRPSRPPTPAAGFRRGSRGAACRQSSTRTDCLS